MYDNTIGNSLLCPINQVMPNLFIGNRKAAMEGEILLTNQISHIVQIQSQTDEPFYPGQFAYHCVRILDLPNSNIELCLPRALNFIYSAILEGGNVLVHCDAGVSRSGSVVCAYLMAVNQWSFDQALQFVQKQRPCVDPNPGFARQLRMMNIAEMRTWLF